MIIAIVAVVAIAGSMIYYYVFFRTGIEKAEIRLQEEKLELEKENQRDEEQEELNKKAALFEALAGLEKWHNESLDQAYKTYREQWDKACKYLGKEPGSDLPNVIKKDIDEEYNKACEKIDKQYQAEIEKTFKLWE